MIITLQTAPTEEPVGLNDLKLHLRIELDQTEEDELLEGLIKSAREHVEDITRRKLLTQTWDYKIQEFPCGDFIKLPFGNLQSVTSAKYKDSAGTETTMTVTTEYLTETNGEGVGRIVLPYGVSWPSTTLYPSNPVTVRFVCGWTAAASVPYQIRAALKMIAADLYQNRSTQELAAGPTFQPNKTVDALLTNYRLWDEF